MFKYKFVMLSLLVVLVPGLAYCQKEVKNQSLTIMGILSKVDMVGSSVYVQTDNGRMVFSVSDQTKKVMHTHEAGLLDMKVGDPVTIQYEMNAPGENNALSIVDNQPTS